MMVVVGYYFMNWTLLI